jgi:putative endopeptidase
MFYFKKSIVFYCFAIVLLSFLPPGARDKRKFIDPANMDLSVRPGANFFLYANGNWLKNNSVPPSKTRWGSFNQLMEDNTRKLHLLLENATKNAASDKNARKVGDFYISGMDSGRLERLGYNPLKNDLQRINNLSTQKDILNEMAYEMVNGAANSPVSIFVGPDKKNSSSYIPQIAQTGVSLPDRDYYIKADAHSSEVRKEFLSHIGRLFEMTGSSAAESGVKAAAVLLIETALAKAQLTRVEMRDVKKVYNKFSFKALSSATSSINWTSLAGDMMLTGTDSIIVLNPGYLKAFDSLITAVPLKYWKAYLEFHLTDAAVSYLSTAFINEDFKFNQVLTGQKELSPRWERVSEQINAHLGDVLGELYVKKYFTAEAKKRMLGLVNNLQESFAERIRNLDWMTDTTKQKALEKLSAFSKKIGYTDKWRDMSSILIIKNDYIGNIRSAEKWAYRDMISLLGKPVDKTRWFTTPSTVNAYYNAVTNDITFPAGILQFPFFDFDADDAVNYGAIGCAIGHEMTHGFDDQGRLSGPDGNLKDWWTKEDASKFNMRAAEVVEEYNAFTILDTLHVNGRLTLGENLADIGGLNIAYQALMKTRQFKEAKKIDGFTPAQRFFLSYAQMWRTNILDEEASKRLLTDRHSPAMARVNEPLRNMDAWYAAFDVKKTDQMYKPKDKRITIW